LVDKLEQKVYDHGIKDNYSNEMQMESMTYETYVTTLEQAIGTENNENGIGQAGQIIDIIRVVSPAEVNVTSV
jgi:uncharacterized protein involved in exopolysaccharide biosynthesis